MVLAVLVMLVGAACVSVPLTIYARAMGRRLGALDGAGVDGQVKEAPRQVPNTGGIAVFGAITLPLLAFLFLVQFGWGHHLSSVVPEFGSHIERVRDQLGAYGWLLICLGVLHVLGLIDDRRPLGPWPKLIVMLAVALAYVVFTGTRVLTLLDPYVGGPWLSVLLTVVWVVAVTNALNFIDNMDGLCAGIAAIAGSCFMAAAIVHKQWFVAGVLALLVGGCVGFLIFNFPWRSRSSATIFLGDGGSLVIGFVLSVMAVRISYAAVPQANLSGSSWHAVLTPLVVLAVPLYDMLGVTFLRLLQGKSPFVGDLQHLSHRLHFGGIQGPGGRGGLTKRDTVIVICGLTGITGLGGIILPSVAPWQGVLIFVQTLLALLLLGLWEFRAAAAHKGDA